LPFWCEDFKTTLQHFYQDVNPLFPTIATFGCAEIFRQVTLIAQNYWLRDTVVITIV
jgi:hypothetical protein